MRRSSTNTPREDFVEKVKKLKGKIHPVEDNTCTNDYQYQLIVYYSGHGSQKKDDDELYEGDWYPQGADGEQLDCQFILNQLESLRDCPTCPQHASCK